MECSVGRGGVDHTPSKQDREEEIRATIAEAITRLRPKGVMETMTEAAYTTTYLNRHICVSKKVFEASEKALKIVHCRQCLEVTEVGVYKATRLVVSYEEDPLKNFKYLASVRCHACGFDMHVAVKHEEASTVIDYDRIVSMLEGAMPAAKERIMEEIVRTAGIRDPGKYIGSSLMAMTAEQQRLADAHARHLVDMASMAARPPTIVGPKYLVP